MPPTPWLAALPKGVLRGARANAPAPLADPFRATASHRCVHALATFFITPASNPQQQQTYVLAALYELEDAVF